MSQSDIPQWVRKDCGTWGEQKRRIWSGCDWAGNIDGYAQSVLGRIRDEQIMVRPDSYVPRETYSRVLRQPWREVFWGAGRDVQQAVIGMPEMPYTVLVLKYVWDPRLELSKDDKADLVGLKRRAFDEIAGRAEYWVYSRLDPGAKKPVLRVRTKPAIKQVLSAMKPELSFSALNRPKLTLNRS